MCNRTYFAGKYLEKAGISSVKAYQRGFSSLSSLSRVRAQLERARAEEISELCGEGDSVAWACLFTRKLPTPETGGVLALSPSELALRRKPSTVQGPRSPLNQEQGPTPLQH